MPFGTGGVKDPPFHPYAAQPREPLGTSHSPAQHRACRQLLGITWKRKIIFWRFYCAVLEHNQLNTPASLTVTRIQGGLNGDGGRE